MLNLHMILRFILFENEDWTMFKTIVLSLKRLPDIGKLAEVFSVTRCIQNIGLR